MSEPPDEHGPERPAVGEIRFASEFEPNTLIYEADTSTPPRIAAPPETTAPPLQAPARIAHFRVLGKIGEGGMGVIYRAADEYLQRLVALKVIGGREKGVDPEHTARLLREARAASRINHPNVVTIFAAGEHDGVAFIAMEYVEGVELSKLVGSDGLDTERALSIAAEVAEGLGAAHRQGIVHRDVKPANVLVCAGDRVKILDFGLAKPWRLTGGRGPALPAEAAVEGLPESEDALGFYNTRAGVIWGSLRYMSPEQFGDEAVDARSDVFSLGIVLYQMLTGRLPFFAKRPREQLIEILRTEPPPVARFRLRVPDYVQRIVSKALAREPSARYADGDALAADLRTALARLRTFGTDEIETSPADALRDAPGREPAAPRADAPRRPRPELTVGSDRVVFPDDGSEYDAVVVSPNVYPWTRRGDGAPQGTAVRIRDEVLEVVAVDSPAADVFRYMLARWPANAVIRRVFDYTPRSVAAYDEERRSRTSEPRSGALGGVISGLLSRRRSD